MKMPVTLRLFGISLTFMMPGSRIFVFFVGVVFWMITGPIVKWALNRVLTETREVVNVSKIYRKNGEVRL